MIEEIAVNGKQYQQNGTNRYNDNQFLSSGSILLHRRGIHLSIRRIFVLMVSFLD